MNNTVQETALQRALEHVPAEDRSHVRSRSEAVIAQLEQLTDADLAALSEQALDRDRELLAALTAYDKAKRPMGEAATLGIKMLEKHHEMEALLQRLHLALKHRTGGIIAFHVTGYVQHGYM